MVLISYQGTFVCRQCKSYARSSGSWACRIPAHIVRIKYLHCSDAPNQCQEAMTVRGLLLLKLQRGAAVGSAMDAAQWVVGSTMDAAQWVMGSTMDAAVHGTVGGSGQI